MYRKLTKSISAHSVRGERRANEDQYLIETIDDIDVYGIFDGHGGGEAALFAKSMFLQVFEEFYQDGTLSQALKRTFLRINDLIADKGLDSGTTATIAVIADENLTIAHVGDSKAALFRGSSVAFETTSHVLTNQNELSNYRASNWFKTKSRLISQGKLKGFKMVVVSRSLGDSFFEDALSPRPDVSELAIEAGDTLVMASDGLWNFVTTQEVGNLLSSSQNLNNASEDLVTIAMNSGSTDNVTVVAVSI